MGNERGGHTETPGKAKTMAVATKGTEGEEIREALRREWAAMSPAERGWALDRAIGCQHPRWVKAGFVGYGPHRRQLYVCTACGHRTTTVPAPSGATGTEQSAR